MKLFNNCGDWEAVDYYVKDITVMARKVQEIQRTTNWITQEEILLKYPLTSFPEIHEINTFIEPYLRLFSSVLIWRRSLKRWMDGDFDVLNADDIENQTDEMSRYVITIQLHCFYNLLIQVFDCLQKGKCFDCRRFSEQGVSNLTPLGKGTKALISSQHL